MVNQTDYVNHLRERMNIAIEEGFYIESISCSYAIIENRTKRIVEHLGKKSAKNMSLDSKIGYIYDQIMTKDSIIDKKLQKLVSYLNYRLIDSQIMIVDPSKTYNDWKFSKDKSTSENKIYQFKQLRNELVHDLATYDSSHPKLIDFDSYIGLAMLGKEVAVELSRIATRMKRKSEISN